MRFAPFDCHSDPPPVLVRSLFAPDLPMFMELCGRNPLRFLTVRMNIEAHGFDGPIVKAWGVFAESRSSLVAVVLKFSNICIPVDLQGEHGAAFASLIDTLAGIAGIRGPVETVRATRAALKRYSPMEFEDSEFMLLRHPPRCEPDALQRARRAGIEDVDKLAQLYSGAGLMFRSRSNVQTKLAEPRVFVAEESAGAGAPVRIASCAMLNVEGADAGLIGGVYTLPASRGKGFASAVTAAISLDLQKEGKMPTLFYENPVAGRVYRQLGFEPVGKWAVLYLSATSASR